MCSHWPHVYSPRPGWHSIPTLLLTLQLMWISCKVQLSEMSYDYQADYHTHKYIYIYIYTGLWTDLNDQHKYDVDESYKNKK